MEKHIKMDYLMLNGLMVKCKTRRKNGTNKKTKKLPMALQKAILKKQKQTKKTKKEKIICLIIHGHGMAE